MLVSQKLAVAAHLHVMLRRKTGRVTDTEWMAENLEYAMAIIRFARAKALEDGHPELTEWAEKLERAVLEPDPVARVPLAQTAAQLLRAQPQPQPQPAIQPAIQPAVQPAPVAASAPAGPRYIGGIR